MPEFDLRGMKVAKYNYDKTQKKISYDTPMSMGDAMTANLELKFAEGRLYAESALAEYMKKVTGLTVSQGVKYIPDETQKLLFKAYELSRSVGSGSPKTVKSMAIISNFFNDSEKYKITRAPNISATSPLFRPTTSHILIRKYCTTTAEITTSNPNNQV